MKSYKVISSKNLPIRLPVFATITTGLLLDRLHSPGWVWGAMGAMLAIIWIGGIVGICRQQSVELFKD